MSDHGRRTTPTGFEESKGQVLTTRRQPAPHVKYRFIQGNTNIFLLEAGIAYQFSRNLAPADPNGSRKPGILNGQNDQARSETYRMDMTLEGANTSALITATGCSEDYTHYCNHPGSTLDENSGAGQAVLDVRTYREVTYHDVYPGIDWVVRSNGTGIEYDPVVRPHADPGPIRMRYTYHEELYLDQEGRLVHGNRLGRFTEEKPIGLQGYRTIPAEFVLDGSVLRFNLGEYDHNEPLVIDPPRAWATYYGGPDVHIIHDVASDPVGNIYAAGVTRSGNSGYIASPGNVIDLHYLFNDDDAFLVKFSSYGTQLWGIYYGGAFADLFEGLAIDSQGDIYCAGTTNDVYLGTCDVHQGAFSGYADELADPTDALLVKFGPDGKRKWGTYYGDYTGIDRGMACAVDVNDNVYLSGYTLSDSAVSSPTAHQVFTGGMNDAFLAKFNSIGQRLWGTYYGGTQDDIALDCATDHNGHVFVVGSTRSNNGNSIAIAGHQNSLSGAADGLLAKFNGNGTRLWGTYYGGTVADTAFTCAADQTGNVLLGGMTSSANGIAVLGAHQSARSGVTDAFLAKFSASGTRQWGTYYGGPSGEYGRDIAIAPDGGILLCGHSESTVSVASGGFQSDFGGGPSDAFLVRFLPSGQRDFETCYGGAGEDRAFACALDPFGSISLSGTTKSQGAIAADGLHATAQQSAFVGNDGKADGFSAKFGLDQNCLGLPDLEAFPRDPCDDGQTCTDNDVYSFACICLGTLLFDNDSDGVCNDVDTICPNGLDPWMPCDDGDPLTAYSYIDLGCTCIGIMTCVLPEDCDDQDPCTMGTCVCGGCVHIPYGTGDISGEILISDMTTHTYSISPIAEVAAYYWELPPGWSSANTTQPQLVATAGSGSGTFELCVTVFFEGCPVPADTCITVDVVAVGIADAGQASAPWYSVRPNPSERSFELIGSGPASASDRFDVQDATGRIVRAPHFPTGQRTSLLDLRDLCPGMYFLNAHRHDRAQVMKLMIRR